MRKSVARRWVEDGETLVDWDGPRRGGRGGGSLPGEWARRNPDAAKTQADRRAFARAMRDVGHTLEEIGEALGITRERVRQFLVGGEKARGVSSGKALRSVDPRRVAEALTACKGNRRKAAKQLGVSLGALAQCAHALGLRSTRHYQNDARRALMRTAVTELAAELRRTPTVMEVAARLFPEADNSVRQPRTMMDGKRLFGSYANLLIECGCTPRAKGSTGSPTFVRKWPDVTVEGAPHGTLSGYAYHHCRCAECREASRLDYRRRKDAGVTPSP